MVRSGIKALACRLLSLIGFAIRLGLIASFFVVGKILFRSEASKESSQPDEEGDEASSETGVLRKETERNESPKPPEIVMPSKEEMPSKKGIADDMESKLSALWEKHGGGRLERAQVKSVMLELQLHLYDNFLAPALSTVAEEQQEKIHKIAQDTEQTWSDLLEKAPGLSKELDELLAKVAARSEPWKERLDVVGLGGCVSWGVRKLTVAAKATEEEVKGVVSPLREKVAGFVASQKEKMLGLEAEMKDAMDAFPSKQRERLVEEWDDGHDAELEQIFGALGRDAITFDEFLAWDAKSGEQTPRLSRQLSGLSGRIEDVTEAPTVVEPVPEPAAA